MKFLKEEWKDYLRSALMTFIAGFATEILMHLDDITIETIKDGSWFGILFVAIRTGIRALFQLYLEKK